MFKQHCWGHGVHPVNQGQVGPAIPFHGQKATAYQSEHEPGVCMNVEVAGLQESKAMTTTATSARLLLGVMPASLANMDTPFSTHQDALAIHHSSPLWTVDPSVHTDILSRLPPFWDHPGAGVHAGGGGVMLRSHSAILCCPASGAAYNRFTNLKGTDAAGALKGAIPTQLVNREGPSPRTPAQPSAPAIDGQALTPGPRDWEGLRKHTQGLHLVRVMASVMLDTLVQAAAEVPFK